MKLCGIELSFKEGELTYKDKTTHVAFNLAGLGFAGVSIGVPCLLNLFGMAYLSTFGWLILMSIVTGGFFFDLSKGTGIYCRDLSKSKDAAKELPNEPSAGS